MLKLNYNELGLFLERVEVSLDTWIAKWVGLTVSNGCAVHIEPSRAALLVPIRELIDLQEALARKPTNIFSKLQIIHIDEENAEVSMRGLWIFEDLEAEEGIFAIALDDFTEVVISRLWQASRN